MGHDSKANRTLKRREPSDRCNVHRSLPKSSFPSIRDGLRPLPPTPCPPAPHPGVLLARQPPCPEADTLSSGCAEHPARFREMRGACGAQEIAPVTQVVDFQPQPPAPQNSTKASPTRVPPLVPPSNTPPHASSPSGVGGFYWAAPTAADPESGAPPRMPCEVLKARGSTV